MRRFSTRASHQFTQFSLFQPLVGNKGISCLINNAGVSGKSYRMDNVSVEALLETYNTNAIAPLMLSKAMIPLLKMGAQQDVKVGALIANMSSVLGSIKMNHPRMSSKGYGGAYPYRTRKVSKKKDE